MAADRPENCFRRVGKPRGLGLKRCSVEKPGRHAKRRGSGEHGLFVGLQIDRDHGGDRRLGEIGIVQRRAHQRHDLLGLSTTLAADAKRQRRRMVDELAIGPRDPLIRHRDRERTGIVERQRRSGEPRSLALDMDARAGQQLRHERLCIAGVGERPAEWWVVERNAEPHIARRGDGWINCEALRKCAGQFVRASVSAEQRHHGAAILGKRDHRRLGRLVRERQRQRADKDAGRAHPDDRGVGREQFPQMAADIVECRLGLGDAAAEAVDGGARDLRRRAPRGFDPARPEDHDGNRAVHRHASARLWTRIIEK